MALPLAIPIAEAIIGGVEAISITEVAAATAAVVSAGAVVVATDSIDPDIFDNTKGPGIDLPDDVDVGSSEGEIVKPESALTQKEKKEAQRAQKRYDNLGNTDYEPHESKAGQNPKPDNKDSSINNRRIPNDEASNKYFNRPNFA